MAALPVLATGCGRSGPLKHGCSGVRCTGKKVWLGVSGWVYLHLNLCGCTAAAWLWTVDSQLQIMVGPLHESPRRRRSCHCRTLACGGLPWRGPLCRGCGRPSAGSQRRRPRRWHRCAAWRVWEATYPHCVRCILAVQGTRSAAAHQLASVHIWALQEPWIGYRFMLNVQGCQLCCPCWKRHQPRQRLQLMAQQQTLPSVSPCPCTLLDTSCCHALAPARSPGRCLLVVESPAVTQAQQNRRL